MKQKAILAFSGGLDTSVVVKYLQEKHNMDVVTVTVDVGQEDNYKKISDKAKKLGVKKHYNVDAKKEFVSDYIFPAIKANALYQKKYCLATALARPLIARKVLEIAKKEKAQPPPFAPLFILHHTSPLVLTLNPNPPYPVYSSSPIIYRISFVLSTLNNTFTVPFAREPQVKSPSST